jgi:hypothetical protein
VAVNANHGVVLDLSPALSDELPVVKRLKLGEGGDLFGTLVVADSRDPREAQGEARAVLRASLDLVVSDFDDDLRLHCDGVAVVRELQLFKPAGHLGEFFVGEAFESFTYRSEARAVGNRQMIIRKPPASSSRTAIGGCDHAIDGFRRLYLEPELASIAGHVGAI